MSEVVVVESRGQKRRVMPAAGRPTLVFKIAVGSLRLTVATRRRAHRPAPGLPLRPGILLGFVLRRRNLGRQLLSSARQRLFLL